MKILMPPMLMKMIDIEKIFENKNITYKTSGNHHTRSGWIQICCPYCGDETFHMGYNIENGYFNCYRCGWKPFWPTMEMLTGEHRNTLKHEIYQIPEKTHTKTPNCGFRCSLPPLTKKVGKPHILYLQSRNFVLKCVSVWNLMGTLYDPKYGNRIVAPIYKNSTNHTNNNIDCWLARDITGKSKYRYLNCPDNCATIPIKSTIYGQWIYPPEKNKNVIITEGATDVWRFGIGAVATYGVSYTMEQLQILKQYKNKYIMYDNDEAGINAAQKLANDLAAFDGDVEIINYDANDVAELSQHCAELIKMELLKMECYL